MLIKSKTLIGALSSLAVHIDSQFVVFSPLGWVLEYFIRFTDGLETRLGVFLHADIGMVLAREFLEGALDLFLSRRRLNAEHCVIVGKFHNSTVLF